MWMYGPTMGYWGMTSSPWIAGQTYRYTPPQQPSPLPLRKGVQAVPSPKRPRTAFANTDSDEPIAKCLNRLYEYVSPMQAVALFVGGVASSFALGWVFKELVQLRNGKGLKVSFDALRKQADQVQTQTATVFDEGIPGIVYQSIKNPEVRGGLLAYLGASVLGYTAGSVAQGFQEVAIRREETQIRADLLNKMTAVVRQSMDLKGQWDRWHREQTKSRLRQLLQDHHVSNADELLQPRWKHAKTEPDNRMHRYLFEPTHLSNSVYSGQPVFNGKKPRMGADFSAAQWDQAIEPPPSWQHSAFKAGFYGAGLVSGVVAQSLYGLIKRSVIPEPPLPKITGHVETMARSVMYEIFNVRNWEALFLQGNRHLLLACLGLAAIAKVGKLLVDGYREVEVTRKHAETELRYQRYNWMHLDTSFHRSAEESATNDALLRLNEDLPTLKHNRNALHVQVQTILSNVGRNSAPKYFSMTPLVGLREARS